MNAIRIAAASVVAVLALTSCKKVLNKDDETFHTRMVNLVQDSPTVQYKIDTTAINSAAYLSGTALAPARPGDHSVSFQVIRPTSLVSTDPTDPIDLGGSFSRSFQKNIDYTIFAYGTLDNIQTLITEAPSGEGAVADDNIEVSVVNADASLQTLTVYVTVPNAGVTAQSIGTVNPGERTTPSTMKLTRPADSTDTTSDLTSSLTFEIHDASGAVIYTSPAITVSEKVRYLFAITPNIGPGPSPVQMMAIDGTSGVFTNTGDQAAVRVVHVSGATPALDVYRATALDAPLFTNLAFRDRTAYALVPPGTVDLVGVPAGSTALQFLFIKEFNIVQGSSSSVYVMGPANSLVTSVPADSRRSIPTQAGFRFLVAAPSRIGSTTGLDIYVTVPGLTLDFTGATSETTDDAAQFKRATALTYQAATDYSAFKSDTYQVRIMEGGTTTVLLDTTITPPAGGVETYVVNDDPDTGSLELIPVEDATP